MQDDNQMIAHLLNCSIADVQAVKKLEAVFPGSIQEGRKLALELGEPVGVHHIVEGAIELAVRTMNLHDSLVVESVLKFAKSMQS